MTNRSGAIIGAPARVNVLLLNLELDKYTVSITRYANSRLEWVQPTSTYGILVGFTHLRMSPEDSMPSAELDRPTPEQFLNLIRRQTRGRLKVYLGSAAGVGKTYAMLREGHRLKAQGVDVVIGLVETHGRRETQDQIGDLEIIAAARGRVPRRDAARDGRRRDHLAPADGLPGR